MSWKSSASIIFLLLLAFFWGYQGQDVLANTQSALSSWWNSSEDATDSTATTSTANDLPPEITALDNPKAPTQLNNPNGNLPNQRLNSEAALNQTHDSPGFPPPPRNLVPQPGLNSPDANLAPQNGEPKNTSLANTLNSIRPGQIPADQLSRRNAYFEQLSQQLRPNSPDGQPPLGNPPGAPPPYQQPPGGNPVPQEPPANLLGEPPADAPPPPGTSIGGTDDIAQSTASAVEELTEEDTEEDDSDEDSADEDSDLEEESDELDPTE